MTFLIKQSSRHFHPNILITFSKPKRFNCRQKCRIKLLKGAATFTLTTLGIMTLVLTFQTGATTHSIATFSISAPNVKTLRKTTLSTTIINSTLSIKTSDRNTLRPMVIGKMAPYKNDYHYLTGQDNFKFLPHLSLNLNDI
jgi:hypothetical protein